MNTEVAGVLDPVIFHREIVNYGRAYSGGTYFVPASGPYFFHTSVAARTGRSVDYSLSGSGYPHSIKRVSTAHSGIDTLGRDVLVDLTNNDQIQMRSLDPHGIYSDGEAQTSWSGFGLNEVMDNVIAFSVSSTSGWDRFGPIAFSNELVNVGSGYDRGMNRFRAPVSGVYYFSFSTGAVTRAPLRVQLQSNLKGRIAELWREAISHNGIDLLSRATLVDLVAGEEVWVDLMGGLLSSSVDTRALSFTGFLYDPNHSRVAWSVHRTSSWDSSGERWELAY